MAKVAVLVPSQELCNLAQPLVGTFPSITLMTLEYIKTSQAESRARELERQGCDLIVARGVQARIIKQSVKLPVGRDQCDPAGAGLRDARAQI